MFPCNFSWFYTYKDLVTPIKMKAKEKLPVEKWPNILDTMNGLGLGIRQRLWTVLKPFFEESKTKI